MINKLWNWWLSTKIGDTCWHYCFHLRHLYEVRFTKMYK